MALVGKAAPFQLTTAVGANPVPFAVSVNILLPGDALAGTKEAFTKGTAFDCANIPELPRKLARKKSIRTEALPSVFMLPTVAAVN